MARIIEFSTECFYSLDDNLEELVIFSVFVIYSLTSSGGTAINQIPFRFCLLPIVAGRIIRGK